MASSTSADNNHIPELGPRTGHVPNKLVSDSTCFQFNSYMPPIDVTSGSWVPIWCGKRDTSDINGKLTEYHTQTLCQVSMEQVIGKANTSMLGAGDITTSHWTFDNTLYNEYLWGKLKSVEAHLKNFLVTVERDSSGGVQWKDEPVFEVMAIPINNLGANDADGTIQFDPDLPPCTYTTTLKEGIKVYNSFDMGLFFRPNACSTIGTGGQSRYATYPTLGQWIKGILRNGAANLWPEALDPYVRINEPFFAYWVRLINIPRGLSNIKVTLSYSWEFKSHWYLTGRRITTRDNKSWFPSEGAELSPGNIDDNIALAKKRKHDELGKKKRSLTDMLSGN